MTDDATPSKPCTRCNQTKLLSDFPPNSRMRDGRNSQCRACNNEQTRAAYYRRKGVEPPSRKGKTPRPPSVVVRDEHGELISRECMDCGIMKAKDEFTKNKGQRDGISSYCRPCLNARNVISRDRLHGGSREYHLRRRYGITGIQFDEMLEAQSGLCDVCKIKSAEHVDHDHATGQVRALLCFTCNVCMGNCGDDPAVLRAAADYLDAWALLHHPERTWRELEAGVFERIPA